MSYHHEYYSPTTGQADCSYSKLGHTYQGQGRQAYVEDCVGNKQALPAHNMYTVPKMCPNGPGPNYPPKYDTLQHGQGSSCGGHFTLQGAFPYAQGCECSGAVQYVQRDCASCAPCNGNGKKNGNGNGNGVVKESYCGPCSGY